MYRNYSKVSSDHWEFIDYPSKYRYELKGYNTIGNELVHEISFTPKRGGLYKGTIYVSATTYAMMQVDVEYAEDKRDENFQLLGIGHAIKYRAFKVLFEKGSDGYYVKYINASTHEFVSIERNFSIMKKKKRFLIDKDLNEIKMKAELFFDNYYNYELLVLDRKEIWHSDYDKVKQPKYFKYKKQEAYSPEMWENPTIIAPSAELEQYKRQNQGE